jgi:hypothetical protein
MPFPPIFFFLFYAPVKENMLCILWDPAAVCGLISIQSTLQAGGFCGADRLYLTLVI